MYQHGGVNGYSNLGDQTSLLKGLHLYIYMQKNIYVRITQEGYIRHYRGITNLLGKTIKNNIIDGLPEEKI